MTAEPSPEGSAPPVVDSNLPDDQTLDVQVTHPNGTTIIVRQLTFHEDRIQLALTVTNANEDDIELAAGGMRLRDDLGTEYRLSPPPGNPEVSVARGSTVDGTFVFLGRVAPRATNLSLFTNQRYSDLDSEFTRTPTMVIDGLPVVRGEDGSSESGPSEDAPSEPSEGS